MKNGLHSNPQIWSTLILLLSSSVLSQISEVDRRPIIDEVRKSLETQRGEFCIDFNLGTTPYDHDVVRNGRTGMFFDPDSTESYFVEKEEHTQYFYLSYDPKVKLTTNNV